MKDATMEHGTAIRARRCAHRVAPLARIACLAAFCILFGVSAARADSATVDGIEWTYSVADGAATIQSGAYTSAIPASTAGAIATPARLGGVPVTSIGSYAFASCSNLVSVAIASGVTNIGDSAFSSCEGLASVQIPDSVAAIGNMAFSSCYGLESIVIPDSVTFLGSYAFVACGLSSATIGKGITRIGEFVFGFCSGLETLDIPDNVTSIGFAFKGCSGLTKVTIGSGVTNIHLTAFSVCPGLKEIIVSGENPAFASEEGVLFDKAKSRLATCPPGKEGVCPVPGSVTVIDEGAFSGCSALTAIEVAPGNGHYSSEDGVLFDKDRKTLVRCPSSKTGSYGIPATVTAILDSAFQSCSGLAAVEIPPAVTNIGYSAFRECSGLESLAIPDSVTAIGDFALYESGLKTLSVPGTWEGTAMLQVAMVPFGCEVIYRSAPEDPVTRTPVPVPYSWLAGHGLGDGTEAGYEAAAAGEAANGRKVWECYGADISPTDAGADFKVKLVLEDGQWVPKPDPEHPGARRYVVEGSPALGEGESWGEVNADSRFFRAKAMLP